MALQIANPTVVEKIQRLAAEIGTTKTAAVERAVDAMLAARGPTGDPHNVRDRLAALLAQLDRIPDLPNAVDPLEWDENGLPI